jgi:hypothetical protein
MGAQLGGAFLDVAKEAAQYGDRSLEVAASVGLQTEEWQKPAYSAKYAGVEEEALATSLTKLSKTMSAVACIKHIY